jgi:hypothetical protein
VAIKGTFRGDLELFLKPKQPVALARFHDGEYHLLRGEPYDARSGWHLYKESWLRDRLRDALQAKLDNYWVGLSPPCCYPQGTAYFRSLATTRLITYATVFWFSNFGRTQAALYKGARSGSFATVGCTKLCGYRIPKNGVANRWDIDGLVDKLVLEERTILLAAGPSACVIAHEYWKRVDPKRRQTILDVGAAMDPLLHGKATRHFQEASSPLKSHCCSWKKTVPWSKSMGRKIRGNRARLAGMRTRFGGKVKKKR